MSAPVKPTKPDVKAVQGESTLAAPKASGLRLIPRHPEAPRVPNRKPSGSAFVDQMTALADSIDWEVKAILRR